MIIKADQNREKIVLKPFFNSSNDPHAVPACSVPSNSGMSKLLEMINKVRLCGSITNCFEKQADLDLLIADDFGMRKLQGQQLLDFMEVIEDRHGRKSTIIASQLPVADWYEVLEQNPTIADAIMDRFAKTAHRIELKGESFRK